MHSLYRPSTVDPSASGLYVACCMQHPLANRRSVGINKTSSLGVPEGYTYVYSSLLAAPCGFPRLPEPLCLSARADRHNAWIDFLCPRLLRHRQSRCTHQCRQAQAARVNQDSRGIKQAAPDVHAHNAPASAAEYHKREWAPTQRQITALRTKHGACHHRCS